MTHIEHHIFLLANDVMVREGLKLLLEDMRLSVLAVGSFAELEHAMMTNAVIPSLLIVASGLFDGEAGIKLIHEMRNRYGSCFPAILLGEENTVAHSKQTDNSIITLPEAGKPKELRQTILNILHKTHSSTAEESEEFEC